MGNLFTEGVGNILTVLLGNVLTAGVGKVLDIYRFKSNSTNAVLETVAETRR